MINEYSHQPPEFDSSEERQQMINRWLETGFSEQSVALHGCSLETLKQNIVQGNIGPHTLASEKKGGSIYYTVPVTQNFIHSQNRLYRQIKRRHRNYYESSLTSFDDQDRQQKLAASHAFRQAMSNFFQRKIAEFSFTDTIDVSDVMQIASEVVPNFDSYNDMAYSAGYMWDGIYSNPNFALVEKIRALVNDETLREWSLQAIKRRGVLLCFGAELFSNATPLPRFREDDEELVFQSERPLPLSVISGVMVFTEAEQEELQT